MDIKKAFVGMCGEAAGIENLVPLWFAMGMDEFSVSPSSVLRVRGQIRSLDTAKLADIVEKKALMQPTSEDIKKTYLNSQL